MWGITIFVFLPSTHPLMIGWLSYSNDSLGFVKCQLCLSTMSIDIHQWVKNFFVFLLLWFNKWSHELSFILSCLFFWNNPKYSQWTLSAQWNTGKRQIMLKYRKPCLFETWPLRTWSLATNCDLSARKLYRSVSFLPAGYFKSWHL